MNFISNILVKIERGIFNNPRVSLGAILLLTAYFALQIPALKMYSEFADLLPQKHPYIQLHNEVRDSFGGANNVIIAVEVEEGDIFTNDTMKLVDDLTNSKFIPVITDSETDPTKAVTLVFCSGKFYFDLVDYREKNNIKNVAIVRIEQLFPLPVKLIISEIKKFSNAKDIVWAQEEPRNMGAWNHIQTYHPIAKNMRPATRRFYGSTASGSYTRFERRHNQVIEYVFDKTKNNFRK